MSKFDFKKYTVLDSPSENARFYQKILHTKLYRIILGVVAGGVVGFLYWYFIGCTGGTCPLTSSPYKTVAMFALLGGMFAKDKKENKG